jgi:hypothetical protein
LTLQFECYIVTATIAVEEGVMAMPVVRISEGTWKRLQAWAVPLEDSPDDALRRVLDAAEAKRSSKVAATAAVREPAAKRSVPTPRGRLGRKRAEKLAQDEYRGPILSSLKELGGKGSMSEVLDVVYAKVKQKLTDADHEMLPSGTDFRWRNTAAWERFKMVQDGLLKPDSPRGTWELTDAGKARAETYTRK